jgi:hypothetical protein
MARLRFRNEVRSACTPRQYRWLMEEQRNRERREREVYSAGEDMLPADFRWYRRGERDPKGPCVFTLFGEPDKYFTAVYPNNAAFDGFVRTGPWTHWHPLTNKPDVGREAIDDAAENVIHGVIQNEKRFGGSLN